MFVLLIFCGQQGYRTFKDYKKVTNKLVNSDVQPAKNPREEKTFTLFAAAVRQDNLPAAVKTPLAAEIEGIVRSDDAWLSFAVIKTPGGQKSYREGEPLAGFNDAYIQEINKDNVVVNYEGATQVLVLNKPDYLSQEKVIELYKTKIEESLKAKKMLATEQTPQPILINLDIKQKRIFAGEALGNKLSGNYAHSEFEYSSALTDQNKPLAQYKSEKFIGIGKNGNLGKIVRDLSGQGSPQNEIDDISAFSEKIVNNLPK